MQEKTKKYYLIIGPHSKKHSHRMLTVIYVFLCIPCRPSGHFGAVLCVDASDPHWMIPSLWWKAYPVAAATTTWWPVTLLLTPWVTTWTTSPTSSARSTTPTRSTTLITPREAPTSQTAWCLTGPSPADTTALSTSWKMRLLWFPTLGEGFQPTRANSDSPSYCWISSTGNFQYLGMAITHYSTSVLPQPWSNGATALGESGIWCTPFRSSSPSPTH